MQFVDGREVGWTEYGPIKDLRGHEGQMQRELVKVDTGGPEDFHFAIVEVKKPKTTNRHNHNWSQIIYLREGAFNYGPDKTREAPGIGYVAEGTFYGPQTQEHYYSVAVLQFGGSSGHGYMGHASIRRANQELSKTGKFVKGIYETTDAGGNIVRKEAGKAVAEFLKGGSVTYPSAQYAEPIWTYLKNYPWIPVPAHPGLEMQYVGTFSNGTVDIKVIRGDAKTAFRQGGEGRRQLMFLDDGLLDLDGEHLGTDSAVYTTESEAAEFRALKPWRALLITLPSFAGARKAAAA